MINLLELYIILSILSTISLTFLYYIYRYHKKLSFVILSLDIGSTLYLLFFALHIFVVDYNLFLAVLFRRIALFFSGVLLLSAYLLSIYLRDYEIKKLDIPILGIYIAYTFHRSILSDFEIVMVSGYCVLSPIHRTIPTLYIYLLFILTTLIGIRYLLLSLTLYKRLNRLEAKRVSFLFLLSALTISVQGLLYIVLLFFNTISIAYFGASIILFIGFILFMITIFVLRNHTMFSISGAYLISFFDANGSEIFTFVSKMKKVTEIEKLMDFIRRILKNLETDNLFLELENLVIAIYATRFFYMIGAFAEYSESLPHLLAKLLEDLEIQLINEDFNEPEASFRVWSAFIKTIKKYKIGL